ncbi:transporter substrate-binding domain-containing protein [Thalassomonas viridans]|uniref:Transporter substrate-binding domain-containing protein n=1 Tax=Thalassomonas viridans TaxID=137584 RepID=A0AAE9Z730_9GAMM|nr:HD domain-containing phosphohydrolase [Thalassomonas viridans]WDE07945.1 transporter substrate-binding domain-containing protein [Thalassomonas viridans]
MSSLSKLTFTIRLTILGTFLLVTAITALIALAMQFYLSREIALTATTTQFNNIAEKVSERTEKMDDTGENLTRMLELYQELNVPASPSPAHPLLPILTQALSDNDLIYQILIGYPDGSSLHLINLNASPLIREKFTATLNDRWVMIKVLPQKPQTLQITEYYDNTLQLRTSHRKNTSYDARTRPWYKKAMRRTGVIKTPPYMFSFLKSPGVTYAKKTLGGHVVGVDISFDSMSAFLRDQYISQAGEVFIFNDNGQVSARRPKPQQVQEKAAPIALSEQEQAYINSLPAIRVSNVYDFPPLEFSVNGAPKGYSVSYLQLLGQKTGLTFEFVNGYSFSQLLAMFRKNEIEMLQTMIPTQSRREYALFSQPYFKSNIVANVRKGEPAVNSFEQLKNKRVALPLNYALSEYLSRKFKKEYPEIKTVLTRDSLGSLKAVQQKRADIYFELAPVSRHLTKNYFIDNIAQNSTMAELPAMSAEFSTYHFMVKPEQAQLLAIINKAIDSVTDGEKQRLRNEWFSPLQVQSNETGQNKHPLDVLPLQQLLAQVGNGQPTTRELTVNNKVYLTYTRALGSLSYDNEYLAILIPIDTIIGPYMEKVIISLLFTAVAIVCFIPLIFYLTRAIVNPIKLLIDENNKVRNRCFDQVTKVPSMIKEINQLSHSMVYMASAMEKHEAEQKNLLDSFIQLLAQAIDDKSPYTGEHCARVPELAFMLAEQVDASQTGRFKDFCFANEREWREFKVAAWLHDCGKITTPEHIVDKGSKLEVIYNRIHEVRMRFEVLLRDADIAYLQQLLAAPEQAEELKQQRDLQKQQITDDFAFVAECNVGGEFMDDEKITRLHTIGKQTWQRNLADNIGLSPEEDRNLPEESTSLPCMEPLLSDKARHLTPRTNGSDRKKAFDFKLPEPVYKQNQGELYNLTIQRGTLTPEDRYIINEHIIATIMMLETLPLPKELAKVPEYAGGHHEKLDGTGYPRRLNAAQLSIPARILAIADIFEALTASDRPYKQGKTLSESLNILHHMSETSHIDKDLFELFLTSGVYLQYAHRFMAEDKIDITDISPYLK